MSSRSHELVMTIESDDESSIARVKSSAKRKRSAPSPPADADAIVETHSDEEIEMGASKPTNGAKKGGKSKPAASSQVPSFTFDEDVIPVLSTQRPVASKVESQRNMLLDKIEETLRLQKFIKKQQKQKERKESQSEREGVDDDMNDDDDDDSLVSDSENSDVSKDGENGESGSDEEIEIPKLSKNTPKPKDSSFVKPLPSPKPLKSIPNSSSSSSRPPSTSSSDWAPHKSDLSLIRDFGALQLSRPLLRAIRDTGWVSPTPVQSAVVPIALSGRDVMVNAATGSGKCWAKGSKLLMFDGSCKKVEEICEGDWLMGPDSTPRVVREGSLVRSPDGSLGQMGKLYQINWNDEARESFQCNVDHVLVLAINERPIVERDGEGWNIKVWKEVNGVPYYHLYNPLHSFSSKETAVVESTRMVREGQWQPLVFETTVDKYLTFPVYVKSVCRMFQPLFVQFQPPVESLSDRVKRIWGHTSSEWTAEEQSVETAWVLGVAIVEGEGNFRLSNPSVIRRIREWCIHMNGTDEHIVFSDGEDTNCKVDLEASSQFRYLLTTYRIGGEVYRIPQDLLRETQEVRKCVLSGIIDRVGSYNPADRVYEFTLKNKQIVDGLSHLSRGLGFRVRRTHTRQHINKSTEDSSVFRIQISGDLHSLSPCISTAYKQCPISRGGESCFDDFVCDSFTINENVGFGRYYGFTLNGTDGRCLMADFTVTHNTAAFMLPVLEKLLQRKSRLAATKCLIVSPTRELAQQCVEMGRSLARYTDIRISLVVGGVAIGPQEQEMRSRPDVVVCTPGRLIDLIYNSHSIHLDDIQFFVLDEGDRLLEMGFTDEMNEIIKSLPRQRQSMLFSATMSSSVSSLVNLSLNQPLHIQIDPYASLVSTLQQEVIRIREKDETRRREAVIVSLCKRIYKTKCILFFPSKTACHRFFLLFSLLKLKCAELNGNLTQMQRLASLDLFKRGEVDFLLCTDLGSRGLDIEGVECVINYSFPRTFVQYCHRVGRTARAGNSGRAVTLVGEKERKHLKELLQNSNDVNKVAAVVKARVVPAALLSKISSKIESLEESMASLLEHEKHEKEIRVAEMEANKSINILKNEDEIMSRPKREWFMTETEKKELKRKWADGEEEQTQESVESEKVKRADRKDQKDKNPKKSKEDPLRGLSRAKKRRKLLDIEDEKERKRALREEKTRFDDVENEQPTKSKPSLNPVASNRLAKKKFREQREKRMENRSGNKEETVRISQSENGDYKEENIEGTVGKTPKINPRYASQSREGRGDHRYDSKKVLQKDRDERKVGRKFQTKGRKAFKSKGKHKRR